jgi:hypothetical protein
VVDFLCGDIFGRGGELVYVVLTSYTYSLY